jgi:hypothetical protein
MKGRRLPACSGLSVRSSTFPRHEPVVRVAPLGSSDIGTAPSTATYCKSHAQRSSRSCEAVVWPMSEAAAVLRRVLCLALPQRLFYTANQLRDWCASVSPCAGTQKTTLLADALHSRADLSPGGTCELVEVSGRLF